MRQILLFLLFCSALFSAKAQTTLFVPKNYQKPYAAGTRSWDGAPGPNYWQNRAQYNIQVNLDPKTRVLRGEASIRYYNNSPDSLKMLRIKLQHDRYRKGAARAYDVTPADVEDEGTHIETVLLNGVALPDKKRNRFATFMDLSISDQVLAPHSNVDLFIKWSYTLPAGEDAAREYVRDSTAFFVPYWYPQVAVYDDISGWASHPYSGLQEFYNDFSDYDVRITLPPGYQAWATGEWQNASDVLQPEALNRWSQAHSSQDVVHVFTEQDWKEGRIFKNKGPQVFRFTATDVPDFAFAASSTYLWDACSAVVDKQTGRRTFVNAVYHVGSTDYPQVASIAADGIRLMSDYLPGYPFPYPVMTIFNGNDGMEYPMMCNDASEAPRSPMTLTVHEVSHTYFPFMMGINEQDHAWMDEGWAAFFDFMLSDSLSGHTLGRVRDYSGIAGTDNDVPPMVKARNLTTAYRNASYQRPQNAYLTLYDLLGHAEFQRCMQFYMNRWKSKHPAPFDFFQTWNQCSGQNLDWLWKPWFFDWGYPDLAVQGVLRDEASNCFVVAIGRNGSLPVPIQLEVEYEDGSKGSFHYNAAVWKDGKQQFKVYCPAGKKPKKASLGLRTIPDAAPENNTWPK